MPTTPSRRKVLIVEDEPSIRNVLYVLLAGLGCEGEVANDSKQALAKIQKERFDAVLLDLRSAHLPPEEMVSSIVDLRPSLVGRVLVITGEVADAETMDMFARLAVPHIKRSNVVAELWNSLRTLPGFAPSATDTPSQ